ncbi:ribosome hibernation-promoting factor, HPF/YfiA family [Seleniivibrio woodruffii]|uniref:Ribosome hibernation promoting factor n=1 Tax=Seleniivibrio woodruffii TaxID=1078050 RepID=A0A4V2PS08_9BACT|nr:ribosome-associated translation inhibitor RaiA [Seleniivibrio woodruffii]TCK60851.1 putative sigma-54 modulation protein [Seleniivibrio woodruffii]TVZ36481.1 putative sigma-54 modulation protein [Seleniivibrio woodruffii]
MQILITAKNIALTDAIRTYAEKKVGRLEKYFDSITEATVVLEVQKNLHIVEVLIAAKGVFMKGLEKSEDLYASIDLATDKIEKQLVKYKEKLKTKKLQDKEFEAPLKLNVFDSASLESIDEDNKLIISKEIPVKPMDVEEAAMQMELLNKAFFVFRNAEDGQISVVYQRDDGNIGLIEA